MRGTEEKKQRGTEEKKRKGRGEGKWVSKAFSYAQR